jgi:adenosylmethionine-8-amino-7-oxononanoate aminotransferase
MAVAAPELVRMDQDHLIHPLYHPNDHRNPLIIVEGHGAMLLDASGREVIDGLAGLWNVTLGHGQVELAEVAAEQMKKLAFASAYVGATNEPAIRLADKIVSIAYPNMESVYFTTAGAESNESAFKTVRFYWKTVGKPDKIKIISRRFGYHGVTMAAMSATGLPVYHQQFGPLVPNFIHIDPPYRFQSADGDLPDDEFGIKAANYLEEAILREGPETVAAFIAEPVMGAGGVIVPPKTYFPRIREICDKYEVLLIADEVITGFGRTGKWFALDHWGVQPDLVSFAKAVTSGYLPLGGIILSKEITRAIREAPYEKRYMHAATYSGHPVCCAVGNKTLEIVERENLVQKAAERGARLLKGLERLYELPAVGEVRGLGLMAAVELAEDRKTRKLLDPKRETAKKVVTMARDMGLYTRAIGDRISLSPPFVTPDDVIDRIPAILYDCIAEVTGK